MEKVNRSTGGLKALVWYKKAIKDFIENFMNIDHKYVNKNAYLIIHWENPRLRNIYKERLKDMGFYMTSDMGNKCLKLKIK